MASRLPVVVAGVGGPLDFVVHAETGLLFDPNSQQSLIEAIGALFTDPILPTTWPGMPGLKRGPQLDPRVGFTARELRYAYPGQSDETSSVVYGIW